MHEELKKKVEASDLETEKGKADLLKESKIQLSLPLIVAVLDERKAE